MSDTRAEQFLNKKQNRYFDKSLFLELEDLCVAKYIANIFFQTMLKINWFVGQQTYLYKKKYFIPSKF